jgi:hypothetical protein
MLSKMMRFVVDVDALVMFVRPGPAQCLIDSSISSERPLEHDRGNARSKAMVVSDIEGENYRNIEYIAQQLASKNHEFLAPWNKDREIPCRNVECLRPPISSEADTSSELTSWRPASFDAGFSRAAALGRRADHLVVTDFHPFASAHNLLFALYVVANMLRIDCTR